MRLTFARPSKSIAETVSGEELGEFIVLSGPNGAGKSNLLEAIAQGALIVEGVSQGPNPQIRLFELAQLVAVAGGMQSAMSYRDTWVPLKQQVDNLVMQYTTNPPNLQRGTDQLEQMVVNSIVGNRQATAQAIERLKTESGKLLSDFTTEDFRRFAPLVTGIKDPFQFSVAELFLSYHDRRTRNEFYQWQLQKNGRSSGTPITNEEFIARYGSPPWDLLNEILALVGLNYTFNQPEGAEDTLSFEARLIDRDSRVSIRAEHLSAGEKTLLAVAMSLYMGARLGEVIELPRVLLLDEPDASLHPSMVQSLIRVVDEVFVQRYSVKVIMTTHSPTTVALAPEHALYVMSRTEQPRLRRASRDEALRTLTVGLSTLSVKVENRRQVFVESETDEASYQDLYRLLRPRIQSDVSLHFIASGKGGKGDADAVKRLVSELRSGGNNSVMGVVDRDRREGSPDGILFSAERYTVENFVLDPVIVGTFLLRERFITPEAAGLPSGARYLDLSSTAAQRLATYVSTSLARSGDDTTQVTCVYCGGFSVQLPKWYLELPGHDLEERLLQRFAELNRYRGRLKAEVINKAFNDFPDFIPEAILRLFSQLAAA
jgi:ABC-type branched-subunit amino acid transport system ATPase component